MEAQADDPQLRQIIFAFSGMQFVENAEDSRAAATSLAWVAILQ